MTAKSVVKTIYKIIRSILFSVTLFVVGMYVLAYILVSIPAFTHKVKNIAASELSTLLGGRVEIADLSIVPFNEAVVDGIEVYDPKGEKCITIEKIAAGISVWRLLTEGKIEITYGEILGLEAEIVQKQKDEPLNIQFIIDALASKDDKKEKKPFEIALKNVVLRKSRASFSRPWLDNKKIGDIDLSHLEISELAADIAFPKISDKDIEVDLRRLSFSMPEIIDINKLGFKGEFGEEGISLHNFILELPSSRIYMPDISIPLKEGEKIEDVLKRREHILEINDSYVTPSNFAFILPELREFREPLSLMVSAKGNIEKATLEEFYLGNPDILTLSFKGALEGLEDLKKSKGELSDFNLTISPLSFNRLSQSLPELSLDLKNGINALGHFSLKGDFTASLSNLAFEGNLDMISDSFSISFEGGMEKWNDQALKGAGEVDIKQLKLKRLLPKVPVENLNANVVVDGIISNKDFQGMLSLVVEDFEYKGKYFDGFSINVNKEEEIISGDIFMHNAIADIDGNFIGDIEGEERSADIKMDIERIDLSEIMDMKHYTGYIISGNLDVNGNAVGIDDIRGDILLKDMSFEAPGKTKKLHLNQLTVVAEVADSIHSLNLRSDWADMRMEGPYKLQYLPNQLISLVETIFPVLIPVEKKREVNFVSDMDFDIVIKKNNTLPEFFNLPFRLLVPVTLSGSVEGSSNSASVTLDIPYLQQGKDKLIYDTKLIANLEGDDGTLDAMIQTTLPVKKGDLALNINLFGKKNGLTTDLHWTNTENSEFKGHILLDTELGKNELTSKPEIKLQIKPSVLQMGSADWHVSNSTLTYTDKYATIRGLRIWHDEQFVEIEGVASPEYADMVKVNLADIDVDYVFDMLQINYVTFGGTATGEIAGHSLLSNNPVAETESFIIKDLSYNGCVIGNALVSSKWNNEEKEIEITADISQEGKRVVLGSGGIWLGRDSLCFDINADKVPVDFVQPFMSVFSSHVGGFATGAVKLFGNFHDIDMVGKIFADSVAVKLDYTNTIYHGSDSVFLNPGEIEIPHFQLYDKFGNSALLTGELKHRYFHDPSFTFRLSEADNFLCYDTNSELNPDWYGTLYGTGSAYLNGEPGLVNISADMTVGGSSAFTFVLNDREYAQDYQFLTFSDKRKEAMKSEMPLTADDFKAMLKKRMHQEEGGLSRFGIDIRATVTPQALFTLVMDPAAGDKITARGRGAMQVKYESDNDEMMMYGKYEIDEGNYNFSLQDIILRDFKIKEGSYISFNGDPLRADLDINATYRVNTNLSDLDKSFSTDRDLNRTNVPVDAVLSVTGNMQSPDITFDIELPTLTQDVERKVKSIISTDDMMNRQIIYLLALNRFYTPEYMGANGNGGELAAVASSTISSQLSNMLGQLTDKFSVSPSFRSDKGDFSDIEVDVALSSKLLNNRLLINGNFGYRDRNNSSTTFVGDFDVEYLLSKNGNLRLKAYNHFNDQNYYLREALTTQGLGIVYRRDFNDWFTFLKKRGKNQNEMEQEDNANNPSEKDKEGIEDNTSSDKNRGRDGDED